MWLEKASTRNCVCEKRMIKVKYKRAKIPYCSGISLLISPAR